MGGVLFIDEAYRLTPEEAGNDYGQEAVETLMQYLNPPPEQVAAVSQQSYPVMIFAGKSHLLPRIVPNEIAGRCQPRRPPLQRMRW